MGLPLPPGRQPSHLDDLLPQDLFKVPQTCLPPTLGRQPQLSTRLWGQLHSFSKVFWGPSRHQGTGLSHHGHAPGLGMVWGKELHSAQEAAAGQGASRAQCEVQGRALAHLGDKGGLPRRRDAGTET